MALSRLSDEKLLGKLLAVVGAQRRLSAKLVEYLAEVESRRLHLEAAYSSMYDFCLRRLGLSEGSAYRHVAAARLCARFPVVLELLREGRLHLSGLALLSSYLTAANHAELLGDAAGKTKAEIETMLRARFPKPDVPAVICSIAEQTEMQCVAPQHGAAARKRDSGSSPCARFDCADGRQGVTPLSAQRHQVQFTASSELRDKLERATALMSHENPSLDLAVVVERAVDALIARLENKKRGKTVQPHKSRGAKAGDVSRQTRREVFERDGARCSYVSSAGERCNARRFLELDHATERALGGGGGRENIRVYCRAHNRYAAEQTFGRDCIEAAIRLRQRRSGSTGSAGQCGEGVAAVPVEIAAKATVSRGERETQVGLAGGDGAISRRSSNGHRYLETRAKLRGALTKLGFRNGEAGRALAEVEREVPGLGAPLDGLIRRALVRLGA